MSQAFVKEGDADDDLPERPVSDRPNYVTATGLAALRDRQEALQNRRAALLKNKSAQADELKRVDRDLRYVDARLESAVLVDRSQDKPADVRFGADVEVAEGGKTRRYRVVGEDEADPAEGKISWSSPLALALMGAKPGDEISWGEAPLRVVSVSYP